MSTDLTFCEALSDPLIALLREADGIESAAYTALMKKVAHQQYGRQVDCPREELAGHVFRKPGSAGAENCSAG